LRDRAGDKCDLAAEAADTPHVETSAVRFLVPPGVLKPLVQEVVDGTIARLRQAEATVPTGQLAYPEDQAARMLGLRKHQLRDERLRGRIRGNRIVGRRIVYEREELVAYLTARRID
jgi:hypothetical protein